MYLVLSDIIAGNYIEELELYQAVVMECPDMPMSLKERIVTRVQYIKLQLECMEDAAQRGLRVGLIKDDTKHTLN